MEEMFVSDVIQQCLISGEIFSINQVSDYQDVGTADDWLQYNNKAVLFCDIDGTIVKALPKFDYENYTKYSFITKNVDVLLEKQAAGYQIVFVTARPKSVDDITTKMLTDMGFKNFTLISNLLNTKRILINDFNTANPYPRAEAINIERDTDKLNLYLK